MGIFRRLASSPTSKPCSLAEKSSLTQTVVARHNKLDSSSPTHFSRKEISTAASSSSMISEAKHRGSVSSEVTTATWSSVASDAKTVAPVQTAVRVPVEPFDVFEYQAAGYLSMSLTDGSQPYLQPLHTKHKNPASSRSSPESLLGMAKNQ